MDNIKGAVVEEFFNAAWHTLDLGETAGPGYAFVVRKLADGLETCLPLKFKSSSQRVIEDARSLNPTSLDLEFFSSCLLGFSLHGLSRVFGTRWSDMIGLDAEIFMFYFVVVEAWQCARGHDGLTCGLFVGDLRL